MQLVSLNIYVHKCKDILHDYRFRDVIGLGIVLGFFLAKSLLFSSKQETLIMCDSYESTSSVVARIAFRLRTLHTYGGNMRFSYNIYIGDSGK